MTLKIKFWWFLLAHDLVNASSITKMISWLKFLGKNLHLVCCASVCAKSEVMLIFIFHQCNVTFLSQNKITLSIATHFGSMTFKSSKSLSLSYSLNIWKFSDFLNKNFHNKFGQNKPICNIENESRVQEQYGYCVVLTKNSWPRNFLKMTLPRVIVP